MPNLILSDLKGDYTTESRSILKILQKVFFKEHPALALSVLHSLIHTEIHHGSKFLVDHMKMLKSIVLGGEKLPKTKKSKFLKGLKSLSRVKQLKLLSIMYRWKAKKPDRATYKKFCDSINQGRSFTKPELRGYQFKNYEIDMYCNFADSCAVHYTPFDSSGTHVLSDNKVTEGPVHIADEIYAMTEAGNIFIENASYLQEIFDIPDRVLGDLILNAEERESAGNTYVGRIAALNKDGALKLRHVANLVKGWQVAISPLVDFYKMIESKHLQSANWDQLEGATKAAIAAGEGFSLSSFDVVSSTDNIHRELFFLLMDPVIEALPNSKKGNLLRKAYKVDKMLCSDGVYLTPFNQRAWYDIGQAMGRWTSKQQLNLTMIRLNVSCGGTHYNSAINGDDVIVWDDEVSRKLEKTFEICDIPISIEKSYIRKRSGEFSGRIITCDEGILPVFKGRKSKLKNDPFGYLRQYGSDGLSLIPYQKRSAVKRVAKYLANQEMGLEEYAAQCGIQVDPLEAEFLLQKSPVIEKQPWSKLWLDQVFGNYEPLLAIKPAFDKHMKNFFTERLSLEQIQKYTSVYHAAQERSRRLTDFKYVAVKRFRAPNNRLDTLVDNLNSHIFETSDKFLIVGYGRGEKAKLFMRLRKDVPPPLGRHATDDYTKSKAHEKIRYVNRLNKKIRQWNAELDQLSKGKPMSPKGQIAAYYTWLNLRDV